MKQNQKIFSRKTNNAILKKALHPVTSCENAEEFNDEDFDSVSLPDSKEKENYLESIGIILIKGDITEGSLVPHIGSILKRDLDPSYHGELYIFINSPGGLLTETFALIDVMHSAKLPITTIGFGSVCSGATMILAAGDPGCRLVMPNTEIMTHTFSAGICGSFLGIKASLVGLEQQHKRILTFWSRHSKYKTKEDIEKHLICANDRYFTATQAKTHGIIDQVVKNQRSNKVRAFARALQLVKKSS